jgi:single-stranded DNA-binding protein
MLNQVALVGEVGEYGCKLSYRENGQPECTLTCVVKEPSRQGDTIFKTFVPVLAYGALAEKAASELEPGMCIAVTGKLAWRAHQKKPADGSKGEGKVVVMVSHLQAIHPAPVASAN